MTVVVCVICDLEKADHDRGRRAGWCNVCMRTTINRTVARPSDPITPESAITFKRQRELFEQERRRA